MKHTSKTYKTQEFFKIRQSLVQALYDFDAFAKANNIIPVIEKIKWRKSEKCLEFLYHRFRILGLLNSDHYSWDSFRIHFWGIDLITEKIQFLGNTNELAVLFRTLAEKGFVFQCTNTELSEHFLDKHGKEIDPNVLRQSLYKEVNVKARRDMLEEKIINELLKYKD